MHLVELRFVIAAAVLHTAIPVAATIAPQRDWGAYVLAASARSTRPEIDIDVSSLEVPKPPDVPDYDLPPLPNDAVAINDPRRPVLPRRAGPHDDLRLPPATAHTANPLDPPDPGAALVSPDAAGPSEYALPPPRGALPGPGSYGIPGLNGGPVWAQPGSLGDPSRPLPAPTEAPRREYDKKRGDKVLADGQRHADQKLGLDFPGKATVKKVMQNAALASEIPYPSSASFTIAVNSQGRVTAVNLNGHSGGGAGAWAQVRNDAKAQLAGSTFALKSAFKKGATLSVNVSASMKTPGGGTSRDGATVSFDVTDIGARPRRSVVVAVAAIPVQ